MKYLECGCCGHYHKEDYSGDCRNDNERHTLKELEFFGYTDYFEIVSLEDQEHKPDEKLTATYFNFSPTRGISVWKGESGELLDPFFSKFACHTCGSKLAGNRYYCTATIGPKHTDEREKLEICEDCYLYFFS